MTSPAEGDGSSSVENDGSGWSEPPWSGWIETTGDALLILEAARRGLIPRVTRRLVDSERKMITSGSVFVFDEDESGIKRWTDGFVWSPSRILGNFLVGYSYVRRITRANTHQLYREIDKRSVNRSKTDQESTEPQDTDPPRKGKPSAAQALTQGLDKHRERLLLGSLTNSHKFKVDGMIKKVRAARLSLLSSAHRDVQTFSLTIAGVSQHLISYYRVADVENGRLRSPSSLPELATLEISPEYLEKTHFRQPPRVEYGPDGIPRYRGEADDPELAATNTRSSEKALRRFDPYSANPSKRARKPKSQRNTLQTEGENAQYSADAYGYPHYPGFAYNASGYPYMQYHVSSPTESASPETPGYGSYVGSYYWPGYSGAGPSIVEAREENDESEPKPEVENAATTSAAV